MSVPSRPALDSLGRTLEEGARESLLSVLAEYAVFSGHFSLSSGRSASYYIDPAQVSMSEPGFSALATLVAEVAESNDIYQIGGLIAGGVPLAIAGSFGLRRYGEESRVMARSFMVRSEPKPHGLGGSLAGHVDTGLRTMLVDDVTSTGSTLCGAIEICRVVGLEVTHCWSLIDRDKGAHLALEAKGVSYSYEFTMADLGVEPHA